MSEQIAATPEQAVNYLNDLLERDPAGINTLMNMRIPAVQGIIDHPHNITGRHGGGISLNMQGIINGLFGPPEGRDIIASLVIPYDENGKMIPVPLDESSPTPARFEYQRFYLMPVSEIPGEGGVT